jgi:MinD-like ATPase involved in chromosome partitioning or flagellar assembly
MTDRRSSDFNDYGPPWQATTDPPGGEAGNSSPGPQPPGPRPPGHGAQPPRQRGDVPPRYEPVEPPLDPDPPVEQVRQVPGINHFGAPSDEGDEERTPPAHPVHPERPGTHRAGPPPPLDETTVSVERSAFPDFSQEQPRQAPEESGQEWGGVTEPYAPAPGPRGEHEPPPGAAPTAAQRRAVPPPRPGRLERPAPRPAEPGAAPAGRGGPGWQQPQPPGEEWPDESQGWSQAQGSAANWNYVDQIRSSELVPTRRMPPGRGWRKAVYYGSFKLINLGQSPDERYQAELEAKVRSLLRGKYKIAVLGKGGVGKTTVAAGVGSMFAELRQDDRVVAVDADTAFGKLASRIDPSTSNSYWELAADRQLDSFSDIRSRVGSNKSGLFVLAGESATARRRMLDPQIYREAVAQLDRYFTLSIVDCGSTMDAPVTREVLRDVDALIVVSSPWFDGASAAGQTLELLANNGLTALLNRTVVVINDSDGQSDKRDRAMLAERFGGRGQKVIEIPFDPHLRPGGVIDIKEEVQRLTRRRLLELAAACAEHFAATADRPRRQRR